jgi:hypothetical protein
VNPQCRLGADTGNRRELDQALGNTVCEIGMSFEASRFDDLRDRGRNAFADARDLAQSTCCRDFGDALRVETQ